MKPSPVRVASRYASSRSIVLMEEIKTPRMGEIYEIEVDWKDFHGDLVIENVSWYTEDEEGHSADYRNFLRQTGVRAEEFESLVRATVEYRYDEYRESRMASRGESR
jgi:hypothetical protein